MSITYAYGTILAVRDGQSTGRRTKHDSPMHGACYNLFLYGLRLFNKSLRNFRNGPRSKQLSGLVTQV